MLGRKKIFVRCISCSYNNVDKKKQFLFIQEIFMQVRAFERYIPLKLYKIVQGFIFCLFVAV